MLPLDDFDIVQTTDPRDFVDCAHMMAATDPWITLGMDYNYCLKAFDGPFKEIFVLKKAGEIAGFVVMQIQGTFKGYIQTICIARDYQGSGFGTRILWFCEQRILGYSPNIFICVSSFNHKALQLYLNFGFEMIGELNDFIKPGFTELLLRKTVGPIANYKPLPLKQG